MALDGAFLSLIKYELEQELIGSRIDRIYQPAKEEIILTLRFKGGVRRVLLSAGAMDARIHLTGTKAENPQSPPMFCMLLRKYLGSGKLVSIRQQGLDRILFLDFETVNELSDPTTVTLAIEIMGRHSNLIVINREGIIIDAIKRVDLEMSSVRQVLPGMRYELPPAEPRYSLVEDDPEEMLSALRELPDGELSKCLLKVLDGASPVLCREIAHFATRGQHRFKSELTEEGYQRLKFSLSAVGDVLRGKNCRPTALLQPDGTPKDFSFIDITQYGTAMVNKYYDTLGQLLDAFYGERDLKERMKQKSGDLLRLLASTSDRIARKLEIRRQELARSTDRETWRIYGDLLSANLHRLEKGMQEITLENFYEGGTPVTIPLSPMLAPAQNAQHYYAEYKKAVTAEKKLTEFVKESEEEYAYIDSVFDALTRATTERELAQLREELAQSGYLRRASAKGKKPEKLNPKKFRSSDGFTIWVGRNNIQNDRLTLKDAHNYDIWFHTQKIPGSHTVIEVRGEEPPNRTLEEAAIIAAYHSRAQNSSLVPVDYTRIKNVKKPSGAKPGMVIYTDFKTAIVTPDRELVEKLEIS